jgi:hypothetical protein
MAIMNDYLESMWKVNGCGLFWGVIQARLRRTENNDESSVGIAAVLAGIWNEYLTIIRRLINDCLNNIDYIALDVMGCWSWTVKGHGFERTQP